MIVEEQLLNILDKTEKIFGNLKFVDHKNKINDLILNLKEQFLIVVLGEFSVGKSSFINAFLGESILTTSILPETCAITLLRYGNKKEIKVIYKDGKVVITDDLEITKKDSKLIDKVELFYPTNLLEDFSLIDTPGLNSIFKDHEDTTQEFLHKADMIIWVFDAFKLGRLKEKEYLEKTKEYAGKMIAVVNKIDVVEEKELPLLKEFLKEHFEGFFNKIFYISSLKELEFRNNKGSEDKGIKELKDYIFNNIVPKTQEIKSMAIIKNAKNIINQGKEALLKSENDFIEKKGFLDEVTIMLNEIKKGIQERLKDIIVNFTQSFFNERKKRCFSFLKKEFSIIKALYHLSKPLDITDRFNKEVLGEKIMREFFNNISKEIEETLSKGWKGRVEEKDIINSVRIPTSYPSLGDELESIINEIYFQVVEKILVLAFVSVVIMLILLALWVVILAWIIPISIVLLGIIIAQIYMKIKFKKYLKLFSKYIEEYSQIITQRIQKIAEDTNNSIFLQAQDKLITEILGYQIAYGEIEDRIKLIQNAKEDLKEILNELNSTLSI